MQRVMIIGCPGSGKSTFARALSKQTGLPLYYMDRLFWNADGTNISREELDARLAEILQYPEWIIDGNYQRTLPVRLEACDTVFLLDYPLDVCLEGIRSRIGTAREDLPWVEPSLDPEFEQYVRDFPAQQLADIYELLTEYPQKDLHIFKTREETARYLAQLKL